MPGELILIGLLVGTFALVWLAIRLEGWLVSRGELPPPGEPPPRRGDP